MSTKQDFTDKQKKRDAAYEAEVKKPRAESNKKGGKKGGKKDN